MGLNIHKVEYDCDSCNDSHQGYACNQKSCFIMVLSRTTDYWKLFHREHDGELRSVDCFSDGQIEALKQMFSDPGQHSPDEGIEITDKEMSEIKSKLFKP